MCDGRCRAGGKAKYAPYQGVVGVTIRGYLLKSASGRKEKWGADKSESSKKKLDWKRRYFVLNAADDPWIDYYKDEAAFLARASPKGTVRVRTATAAADAHTGGFTVVRARLVVPPATHTGRSSRFG